MTCCSRRDFVALQLLSPLSPSFAPLLFKQMHERDLLHHGLKHQMPMESAYSKADIKESNASKKVLPEINVQLRTFSFQLCLCPKRIPRL